LPHATFEPVQGRYFVFAKDVGGNEFAQLYRYDVADGHVTLLTDGGRSQNGGVVWSTKGDRSRLRIDAPQRDRSRHLRHESGGSEDRPAGAAGHGRRLAGARLVAGRQPPAGRRVRVDHQEHAVAGRGGRAGRRRSLTNAAEDVSYGAAAFSADGRGVYVTTDKDSEFQRLGYIDVATKQLTLLATDSSGTPAGPRASSAGWSPRSCPSRS
jgi:hypothetical protein